MNRYQPCSVVSFKDGSQYPYWECEFVESRHGSDVFKNPKDEYEETMHVVDGLWDCKKRRIVPFFVIERRDENDAFPVGTKVAVEDSRAVRIEVVKEVIYPEYEDYYAKYKDMMGSAQLEGVEIPPGTKTIVIRHYRPTHVFESGRQCKFHHYVKSIIE